VFWLICDDISPGVISYESTYQYFPQTHDSSDVISFESIRQIQGVWLEAIKPRKSVVMPCKMCGDASLAMLPFGAFPIGSGARMEKSIFLSSQTPCRQISFRKIFLAWKSKL